MHVAGLLVVWLFLHFQSVLGIGQFTNPSQSDGSTSYDLGDSITISWTDTADYNVLSLGVYQESNATTSWLIENSRNHPTSYTWTINVDQLGFDLTGTRLFQLIIVNGTNFGQPFESAVFSVLGSSSSAVVTETATATGSTPVVTVTVTGTNTPTTAPPPFATGSRPISIGARVGFWLGLIFGVGLLLGVAAFFYRKKYGNGAVRNPTNAPESDGTAIPMQNNVATQQQPLEYYAVKPPPTQVRADMPMEYYAVPEAKPSTVPQAPPPGRESGYEAARAGEGAS